MEELSQKWPIVYKINHSTDYELFGEYLFNTGYFKNIEHLVKIYNVCPVTSMQCFILEAYNSIVAVL